MNPLFQGVTARRSQNMRAIRSKHSGTTERKLRAALASGGLRGWRMHVKELSGEPDFYFRGSRLAVFVDGCFWHCCPKCGHIPKTNRSYWKEKLARNKRRDRTNQKLLQKQGVRVIRFWECQLRENLKGCVKKLTAAVSRGNAPNL